MKLFTWKYFSLYASWQGVKAPGCNFWGRCRVGRRVPLQTIPHPAPPGRTPHPRPAHRHRKTKNEPSLMHQFSEALWMNYRSRICSAWCWKRVVNKSMSSYIHVYTIYIVRHKEGIPYDLFKLCLRSLEKPHSKNFTVMCGRQFSVQLTNSWTLFCPQTYTKESCKPFPGTG